MASVKQTKTVKAACEYLRKKVRYESAGLRLPGNDNMNAPEDTPAIRAATRIYVESWIIPVIDAIAAGDTKLIKRLIN